MFFKYFCFIFRIYLKSYLLIKLFIERAFVRIFTINIYISIDDFTYTIIKKTWKFSFRRVSSFKRGNFIKSINFRVQYPVTPISWSDCHFSSLYLWVDFSCLKNDEAFKSDSHVPENFCQVKIFPSDVRKNAIICLFGISKWK